MSKPSRDHRSRVAGALAALLLALPSSALAVGGSDESPAGQIDKNTQTCQKLIGKKGVFFARRSAEAILSCLDSALKCDEKPSDATATDCRRRLLSPESGRCAEGQLDLGSPLIGNGASGQAIANAGSRAKLIREYNRYIDIVEKKCGSADTSDGSSGLGFGGETDPGALADLTNADPGGIGCLANELVLQTTPRANPILQELLPFHETCVVAGAGAQLGDDCSVGGDTDCGSGGVCGRLAGTLAAGSLRSCAATSSLPGSGQLTAFLADLPGFPGSPVADDGSLRAGATLLYTNNGDGTITDQNTGLMWEEKSATPGLHSVSDTYPWSSASIDTIWNWLEDVNAEGGTGLAGFSDWRIPNAKELHTIRDYEPSGSGIAFAFGETSATPYWSSTSLDAANAWTQAFPGDVTPAAKTTALAVRAVRDGTVQGSVPLPVEVTTQLVVGGLGFPVYGTAPPDPGDSRIFVLEIGGRIQIVDGGAVQGTFLDLSSVVDTSGEGGLLGLAFAPDYVTSGDFYVYYTVDTTSFRSRVSRFQRSANPDVADAGSEEIILEVPQFATNHNGGTIAFGSDGFLYFGLGDGGGGGDPQEEGQDPSTLLGSMLRLDVSGGGTGYAIPASNPFVGTPGFLDEIWSYGLRNPYRFAFDRLSGDLWIGDVGQNTIEEVDYEPAGAGGRNYGWDVMEGSQCFEPSSNCDTTGKVLPIVEYPHPEGCSITGGFAYRGSLLGAFHQGRFFYSDFCSGFLRSIDPGGLSSLEHQSGGLGSVLGFAQDSSGELYVLNSAGQMLQLVPSP